MKDPEVRRILNSTSPHEILGVSKHATFSEIRVRYRELARRYNPSRGINYMVPEKERLSKMMAQINSAFSELRRNHKEANMPNGERAESSEDVLNELRKRLQRDQPSQFYKPRRPDPIPKERSSQETGMKDPEVQRILNSTSPYEILGVSKHATFSEIKARYKEMARKHNPSLGIIHKSVPEKERSSKIMAQINSAFSELRQNHREKS